MRRADITQERRTMPSAQGLDHGVFHSRFRSCRGGPDAETVASELIAWGSLPPSCKPLNCAMKRGLVMDFFSPSAKKYPGESPLQLMNFIMAVSGHSRQPVRPRRMLAPAPN